MVGGFFEVEYQFKLRDMFSKEADKIIAKFDKVRDAATRANTRFIELAKNVKSSGDNLKQLSNGIKPVNQGLKTMNQSAKSVTASVRAQNKALAAQSRALKVARASMVDYNRMAGVMMQAGQGLFRTGNMLGLTVTAPIVAAAFAGGKKFIGREERATQVRKTAGLSRENATYLIKLANKYSGRNPTSTEEMLDIAGILGQAGFGSDSRAGTEELMNKSTTVAKMMAAFDMSSEQAGTTYAKMYQNTKSLMNKNKDSKLYGKFSDQYFNRLLDFVDLLENTSPINASEIFEAMKTRTLASGLMIPGGMDPFETAAITTQMLRFKSPSRASNIVSTLFKSFADPEKVGEKMAKQFRDTPFETLIGFFDVMKGSKTDKAYDMASAVNKSYSGELSAIASFETDIRKMAKEAERLKAIAEQERISGNIQQGGLMYGNARYGLDESYRLKVDTFLGKLTTLKNNVDNALANFFTRIEPTLTRFIEKITPKVLAFAEAIESMPEQQLWVIVGALTSFALLAPTLMIVGTLLNSISAIMKAIATVRSGVFIAIFKEFETFLFKMLGLGSLLGVTTGASGATVVGGSAMVGVGGAGLKALGIGDASRLVGAGALGLGVRGLGSLKTGIGGIGALSPQALAATHASKVAGGGKMFASSMAGKNTVGFMANIKSLLASGGKNAGGLLSKISGGQFFKTAGAIGKNFAMFSVMSSLLEGAFTGKWMEALLGGGGGWLGGALGGAAVGTLGGGPIGTILGALGGGFLGTEMGKGLAGGIKQLFPDIDNAFIQGLKVVWNILKLIGEMISFVWKEASYMFEDLMTATNAFINKHTKIKSFLDWVAQGVRDIYLGLSWVNQAILELKARIGDKAAEREYERGEKEREEKFKKDLTYKFGPTAGVGATEQHQLTIKVIDRDGNPVTHNLNTGASTVASGVTGLPVKINFGLPTHGIR